MNEFQEQKKADKKTNHRNDNKNQAVQPSIVDPQENIKPMSIVQPPKDREHKARNNEQRGGLLTNPYIKRKNIAKHKLQKPVKVDGKKKNRQNQKTNSSSISTKGKKGHLKEASLRRSLRNSGNDKPNYSDEHYMQEHSDDTSGSEVNTIVEQKETGRAAYKIQNMENKNNLGLQPQKHVRNKDRMFHRRLSFGLADAKSKNAQVIKGQAIHDKLKEYCGEPLKGNRIAVAVTLAQRTETSMHEETVYLENVFSSGKDAPGQWSKSKTNMVLGLNSLTKNEVDRKTLQENVQKGKDSAISAKYNHSEQEFIYRLNNDQDVLLKPIGQAQSKLQSLKEGGNAKYIAIIDIHSQPNSVCNECFRILTALTKSNEFKTQVADKLGAQLNDVNLAVRTSSDVAFRIQGHAQKLSKKAEKAEPRVYEYQESQFPVIHGQFPENIAKRPENTEAYSNSSNMSHSWIREANAANAIDLPSPPCSPQP